MKDVSAMENYGEILIYQPDDGLTNVELKIQDETVWLTQQQMAELFQTSRTNVVEHIKLFMMKANWTRFQLVGNSDRFEKKENVKWQEKFRFITSI